MWGGVEAMKGGVMLAPCSPPPLCADPLNPPSTQQDQVAKLRAEREAAGRDVALLRSDLDAARGDK
jgi:hypothetical protein